MKPKSIYCSILVAILGPLSFSMPGPAQTKTWIELTSTGSQAARKGDSQQALKLFSLALAEAAKDKTKNPWYAISLNNIGQVEQNIGHLSKAELNFKQFIEIMKSIEGAKSMPVARGLSSLGYVYCEQGKYLPAESAYTEALQITSLHPGEKADVYLQPLNGLTDLYLTQGNAQKAKIYAEKAMAYLRSNKAVDWLQTSTVLNNLACVDKALGKLAEAQGLLEKCIELPKLNNTPDDPSLVHTLDNLAGVYEKQGQYAKAKDCYVKAIAVANKVLGPEHPDTKRLRLNMLTFEGQFGDTTHAIKDVATLEAEQNSNKELPDRESQAIQLAKAMTLAGSGKRTEAIAILQTVIKSSAESGNLELNAIALNNLGTIEFQNKHFSLAESLITQSIQIRKTVFGANSVSVASALTNLAEVFRATGQTDKAEELYKQVIKICETPSLECKPVLINCLQNYALLCDDLERTTESKALRERAKCLEKASAL